MSGTLQAALALYGRLPFTERFHVHARAFSAPLEAVAARVPEGRVADIGCGHGLLSALLALTAPTRRLHGVDPDARKIDWARAALSRLPNAELHVGTVETLLTRAAGTFDAAVVCDVLYLLPWERWPGFLRSVHGLLRGRGLLLLKEAEGDGSWKHLKCLAQEWMMVKALGRTKPSGGLVLKPRAEVEALLSGAGFTVRETVELGRGYSTPHILYVASSAP